MKALMSLVVAVAMTTTGPVWANPGAAPGAASASPVHMLRHMAALYGIVVLRSFVNLTYEDVRIESGTGDLVVSGLRIYAGLGRGPRQRCVVTVDGLRLAGANGLDRLGFAITLHGVTVPHGCLPPPVAAKLSDFGYDQVTVDRASIDLDYHVPDSSAEMAVSASVAGVAAIDFWAEFDRVWFNVPIPVLGDFEDVAAGFLPLARLGAAELVIANRGLLEALKPVLQKMLGGDLSRAPRMLRSMLGAMLSRGGRHDLTAQEKAFIDDLAAQVARFLKQGDRIVVTADPEGGGVWLNQWVMRSPSALIAALDPVVSAAPAAYRRVIPPDVLAAALAGGDTLNAKTRLRVGEALITGVGAPRVVAKGRALLAPLADNWNAEAALLVARAAYEMGEPASAYAMTLVAMAGGLSEAIGLANKLEAELPLTTVLTAQAQAARSWPRADDAAAKTTALVAAGDIPGMVRRARSLVTGRGRPRNYAAAYYWASLAAAAGGRGAAALRDRLNARFSGQPGWAETVAAQQANALETWTGGLAKTIAASTE